MQPDRLGHRGLAIVGRLGGLGLAARAQACSRQANEQQHEGEVCVRPCGAFRVNDSVAVMVSPFGGRGKAGNVSAPAFVHRSCRGTIQARCDATGCKLASHCNNSAFTRSGCSQVIKWPAPGTTSSCACGTAARSRAECSSGVSRSPSPQATSSGQRMSASHGRMSARAITARFCAISCAAPARRIWLHVVVDAHRDPPACVGMEREHRVGAQHAFGRGPARNSTIASLRSAGSTQGVSARALHDSSASAAMRCGASRCGVQRQHAAHRAAHQHQRPGVTSASSARAIAGRSAWRWCTVPTCTACCVDKRQAIDHATARRRTPSRATGSRWTSVCRSIAWTIGIMTELIVMRHGETDWNRQHTLPGSDRRAAQRRRACAGRAPGAASAPTSRFDAVVASDLQRARSTAESAAAGRTPSRASRCGASSRSAMLEGLRRADHHRATSAAVGVKWLQPRCRLRVAGRRRERAHVPNPRAGGAAARWCSALDGRTGAPVFTPRRRARHAVRARRATRRCMGRACADIPNTGINRLRWRDRHAPVLEWADAAHLRRLPEPDTTPLGAR